MKHSYLAAFLACSIGFCAVVPAYAGLPVKSIYSSRAEGSGGATSLASITVWPGYGTNLSLIPTGEVVRKAWLDNPSRIVLDSDGGLTGGGGQNSGSQVLHLKQIQPLDIPGITKAPSTMLTLIVDGPSGKKIYQFQVIVAKGSPQYHTLSVLPNSKPLTSITASSDTGVSVEDVRQGLQFAISKGWARSNSRLIPQVQSFISQIQNGETTKAASGSSGISMALVSRLESLGKQSTVAVKDSSTTPSQWAADQTEGTPIASLPPTLQEQKPEPSAPQVVQNSSLEKKSELTPAAPPQVVATSAPPVASPTSAQLAQPAKATPQQVLSTIPIPMKDGSTVTADKLLAVQQRIWDINKGKYRKTFGSFLNALVNSQEPPEARLQEVLKITGQAFTLNDVQWLAQIGLQEETSPKTSSIQGVSP